MAPLRVALVHNLRPGGALRTVREHHRFFIGETREFCLQTANPVTSSAHMVPFKPRADSLAPALRPLPRHLDLVALVLAWRALAHAVNRAECDVVLAHPCQFLQAPLALRWVQIPTVYFCHEPRRVDYEPAAAERVNPRTRALYGPLHRAERTLDRAAVASTDVLLTNSRFTAQGIRRAYGRASEPVPLGVPDRFRQPVPEIHRTHLLSVGALLPAKGHDRAIEAAALTTRRWPLIVVAPRADPVEAERLEGLASRHGVDLEIRIGVTDEQLRDLYCSSVCTLYLAREEPFGLVSLEAQACGSPVLVADEGGLPETMLESETGWTVDRDDGNAAARAIDRLGDHDLQRRFSIQAREHGSARSWEASTRHIEAVLKGAVSA